MPERKVVITAEEYNRLRTADDWLGALEAAGIDNSPAYEEAERVPERDYSLERPVFADLVVPNGIVEGDRSGSAEARDRHEQTLNDWLPG